MHLVKWIRKNQRKLMAFVVIFIMLAFVGGSALMQLLNRTGSGINKALANYGNKDKITRKDLIQARNELTVLKYLRTDLFLRFRSTLLGLPDYKCRFLGQLLFADSQLGEGVYQELLQGMAQGQYNFSIEQIDNFFRQASGNGEIYWILLNAEAQKAGCIVPNQTAKAVLKQFIPQIPINDTGQSATAAQVVEGIVKSQGVTEDQISRTFADLLGILTYAEMVTDNEDITIDQLRSKIGRQGEKINTEFVKFPAEDFVEEQSQPTDEQLSEQFQQYKGFLPNTVNNENPYGFGYKLPARIELEYLIIKTDDIKAQIGEIPSEQMEEFYRLNADSPEYAYLFKYEEQIDPNDPESKVKKTKTYAQISNNIKNILTEEKADRRAEMIINEARSIIEGGFASLDITEATVEQLKSGAGSYTEGAEKLKAKYGLEVYTGKTGFLSMESISADQYLSRMSMEGRSGANILLSRIVLAVEEAAGVTLSRFETSRPKMWENLGPFRDGMGSVIALVRITNAVKESVPVDIDITFSSRGVVLDEEVEENVYSVKERVIEDCKLLMAMATAKTKAEQLLKIVSEKGWTGGLEEFNKLQEDTPEKSEEEGKITLQTNKYSIEKMNDRTRISQVEIEAMRSRFGDNPMAKTYLKNMAETGQLLERFYSLIEPGQSRADNINSFIEHKPGVSCYAVKSISRTPVTKEEYNSTKSITAFQTDQTLSHSLAIVHFMPENIFKRMNYKVIKEESEESIQAENAENADVTDGE